jgi:hypothetical protein
LYIFNSHRIGHDGSGHFQRFVGCVDSSRYHIDSIIQDLILTEKMGHDIDEVCLNLAFGVKLRARVAGVVRIGLITPYVSFENYAA